jgi:hypothetical protein
MTTWTTLHLAALLLWSATPSVAGRTGGSPAPVPSGDDIAQDHTAQDHTAQDPATFARLVAAQACTTVSEHARLAFAYTYGGTSFDRGVGAGLDADENAYFIGSFRGTFDFDPSEASFPLSSANRDVYVASYDAFGRFRFAFRIGTAHASAESAGGIAVHDDGRFVITGSQPFGTIDYDPAPDHAELRSGKLFIAGYESDGSFRFAVTPGEEDVAGGTGNAVALDDRGHAYVTGQFSGALDFNPAGDPKVLTSAGSYDAFVASYTSDGDLRFAFSLGSAEADEGRGIAADGDGNIYVTGIYRGTVDFAPMNGSVSGSVLTAPAEGAAFLASYDSAGQFRFAISLGDAGYTIGHGVATNDDYILLTGQFRDRVTFDPNDDDSDGNLQEHTAEGNGSAFLAGYSSTGAFRFVQIPRGGTSSGQAVAVDASGNSYVTGSLGGSAVFGSDPRDEPLCGGSGTGVFVASYSESGVYRGGFALGGNGLNTGNGIAAGSGEAVVITGEFTHQTDFDPGVGEDLRYAAGQNDLFMARYALSLPTNVSRESTDAFALELTPPHPNPFREQCSFRISVLHPQRVVVAVYDALGRRVAVLHNGMIVPGQHQALTFDASGLPAGAYFVRAEGETFSTGATAIRLR